MFVLNVLRVSGGLSKEDRGIRAASAPHSGFLNLLEPSMSMI